MSLSRLSIAELLGVVGIFAVGFSCLINASSPWAGLALSFTIATGSTEV